MAGGIGTRLSITDAAVIDFLTSHATWERASEPSFSRRGSATVTTQRIKPSLPERTYFLWVSRNIACIRYLWQNLIVCLHSMC